MKLKLFKEVAMPASPVADAIYFIDDGNAFNFAEAFVTDSSSVPHAIGNTTMIQAIATAADDYVVSGAVGGANGTDLILQMNQGGTPVTIDVSTLKADIRLVSGSYNASNGALDLIVNDQTTGTNTTISVPVGNLLLSVTDSTMSGDGTAGNPLSVEFSSDANNVLVAGTDGKLFVDGATLHTHANKAVLDLLGEAPTDPNCLTYRGNPVLAWTSTAW